MADKLSVTLADFNDPRKTFTAQLRRFTPETYEQWQDIDQDAKDIMARAVWPYRDENAPEELEARLVFNREARKAMARGRLVGTFLRLRAIIDTKRIDVDAHREWIESAPDGDVWPVIGQDLGECERALDSFRKLLGVA